MKTKRGVLKSMLQENQVSKTKRQTEWGTQNSDLFPEKTDRKLLEELKQKNSEVKQK